MADIKKLLGKKISQIRKAKGFSQIQFAEMLGLSTNALSLIETGNGFCTAETLEKILKKLDIEPQDLFTFGGTKTEKELYQDIVKTLDIFKKDRTKLLAIKNFLNALV